MPAPVVTSHLTAKRLTLAAVALVAILVIFGLAATTWYHLPRFGVVKRGILYRSAQPDTSDLKQMVRRYGIKTIVCLRPTSEKPDTAWYPAERSFAERHGLQLITIEIPAGDVPDADAVESFLQICRDPDKQPVLVHCAAGVVRTGYMVAAYRIAVDGWSADQAVDEMKRYRFRPERYPRHVEALRRYRQTGPASTSAAIIWPG